MGLPGSGKTYLARELKKFLEDNSTLEHMTQGRLDFYGELVPPLNWHATVDWFNADDIRKNLTTGILVKRDVLDKALEC